MLIRPSGVFLGVTVAVLFVVLNGGLVAGQVSYTDCPNLDSPGVGDLAVFGVIGPAIATLQDCKNLCSSSSGCIGAVYYSGNCFLKDTNILTVAVSSLAPDTYFIQAPYTCPTVGNTFVGTVYNQCDNLDTPNVGDILVEGLLGYPLPTLFDCMDLCSSVSGCVGAVYFSGKCFPKTSDVLVSPVTSQSPDTYVISSAYGCPALGTTFSSTRYVQCANLDTPGAGDIFAQPEPTLAACMELCAGVSGCIGAVYYSGTCYLKNSAALTAGTDMLSPDTFFLPAGYNCPAPGNTIASAQYVQCLNLDTPGVGDISINGVIGPTEASVQDCMDLCFGTSGCVGGVYYNGQCFPKTSAVLSAPVVSLSPDVYFIAAAGGYKCPSPTFISTRYLQCANLDTPGVGDIPINGGIGAPQATLDDCMELCSSTAGCIGAVYYQGNCFAKNNAIIGSPTNFFASDTYFILRSYDTVCPAPGGAF